MTDKKKNPWAPAGSKELRSAAARKQKAANEKESRTSNVVRQSAWDKLRGKDGEMKRR